MTRFQSTAVASVALALPASLCFAKPIRRSSIPPKFVDCVLAGHHLREAPLIGQFDSSSGYCLFGGGNAAKPRLILTTDLQFAGFDGGGGSGELTRYRKTLPRVRLLLQTGRGVAIGDTTSRVRKKLGLPTESRCEKWGYRVQHKVWIYTFVYQYGLQKWRYMARYTFRRDKLWAMEFTITTTARGRFY
ncbi:MAG: hypothetical protein HY318_08750 [Armatimonadetes bacterium]|nr:hypothetical protein [Armatimonadota bacterium]